MDNDAKIQQMSFSIHDFPDPNVLDERQAVCNNQLG